MRNRVGRTWVLWSLLITKSSILKNGGILPPWDDTSWFEIIQILKDPHLPDLLSPPFRFSSFPWNWADDLTPVRYQINQIYVEMKFQTIFIFDLGLSLINFTFDQTRILTPKSSQRCQSQQSESHKIPREGLLGLYCGLPNISTKSIEKLWILLFILKWIYEYKFADHHLHKMFMWVVIQRIFWDTF